MVERLPKVKVNGKKVQEIDIYYRGVGIISFPIRFDNVKLFIGKTLDIKAV